MSFNRLAFIVPLIVLAHVSLADGEKGVSVYNAQFTVSSGQLAYLSESIVSAINNQLLSFPEIKIYSVDSKIESTFQDLNQMLRLDKVQLLQIRRQTGFDGFVAGSLEQTGQEIFVKLHLVDFSSGRIYFNDQFEGKFGSGLLESIEKQVRAFANTLIHYYDSTITITSEPTNADVNVNGHMVGKTPIKSLDVTDGILKIKIDKDGYTPYQKEVVVFRGQRTYVHGHMYDQITEHLLNKKSSWKLDSMNFSIGTCMQWQNWSEINAETGNVTNFRYTSKFNRWELGLEVSTAMGSSWHANQKFETYLGKDSSTNEFEISFSRFCLIGQFNLVEKLNQFDLYVGSQLGYASTHSSQYNLGWYGLSDNNLEGRYINAVIGGEIGMRFYLGKALKLAPFIGGNFAGEMSYKHKTANYWGEAMYSTKSLGSDNFYFGVAVTYSYWSLGK